MSPEIQAPSSDRREAIADAAIALFDVRGYHGTRMKDIGEHLGIRAPSLYNHVDSKQELLREIMFDYMEGLLGEHRLAIDSTDNVVEKLRRAMEAHVRYTSRHPRETRIGAREVPNLEEPARAQLLDLRKEYGDNWQALIDRGVDEEDFTAKDSQLAAHALTQMGLGVALWVRPLPLSESELAYTLGEMALRLLGVQDPPSPADPGPVSSASTD
jgi:AcrR family transcriptional regulator